MGVSPVAYNLVHEVIHKICGYFSSPFSKRGLTANTLPQRADFRGILATLSCFSEPK